MSTLHRFEAACLVTLLVIGLAWIVRPRRSCHNCATSAIGTLKSLSTSQEQFKQQCLVDQDHDGVGEYATFQELCGAVPCRQSGIAAEPTFMSRNLGTSAASGRVGQAEKSGYYFLIYLPDSNGAPHAEKSVLLRGAMAADADRQETVWVCYAWPKTEDSGRRTFVINHEGQVYSATRRDPTWMPSPYAAFLVPCDITVPIRDRTPSATGDEWEAVGG